MAGTPSINENLVKGKDEIVFTKKNVAVGLDVKEGKILKVYPFSEFLGHLFTGDMIDSVNGQKVTNTPDLLKVISSNVPGKIVVEYRRDEHCTYHLKPLPARKVGFELFEITLIWRTGGTPLGLLIHRDYTGQVVVAMVESGTTASRAIRAGDYLLKVNGKDISDRDGARKAIMESINLSKKVTMILERSNASIVVLPPVTPAPSAAPPSLASPAPPSVSAPPPSSPAPPSIAAPAPSTPPPPPSVSAASTADFTPTQYGAAPITPSQTSMVAPVSLSAPPVNKTIDVLLPPDVLAIMEANKNFYKVPCTLPPCLKKSKEPSTTNHIDLPNDSEENIIPYDPSPKPLKKTPKRVGS